MIRINKKLKIEAYATTFMIFDEGSLLSWSDVLIIWWPYFFTFLSRSLSITFRAFFKDQDFSFRRGLFYLFPSPIFIFKQDLFAELLSLAHTPTFKSSKKSTPSLFTQTPTLYKNQTHNNSFINLKTPKTPPQPLPHPHPLPYKLLFYKLFNKNM